MRLDFPINKCPHCGSEFFIRKIRFKGHGIEIYTSDGKFSKDNSGLHDHIGYILNKRFYCGDCDKYLFKLD